MDLEASDDVRRLLATFQKFAKAESGVNSPFSVLNLVK